MNVKKNYELKLQYNNGFRFKPKQIVEYPEEPTVEKIWHIDCKNNRVFFTGGIFEREYKLEKYRYDKNSNIYLIDILGEEG